MNKTVEINIPEHVIIELDDNSVKIIRKGMRSFMNRGSNGTQTIPLQTIIGTDFKPAGMVAGHINFITAAGNQSTSGLFSMGAGSDYSKANSVVFRSNSDEVAEINDFIENYIANKNNQPNVVNQTSDADELAKFKNLLDDGTITQEEFDAKKKQILGL